MLEFQLQQFPFRFGLDEGTDPNQQPPGRLTTLENGEWVKGGRVQKRDGVESPFGTTYYSGASSGSITAGKRFIARGSELAFTDGSYIYNYSSERAGWQRGDQVPDVGLEWTTGLDTNDGVSAVDVAYSSPYLIQVWRTGAPNDATRNIWVRVIDATSGMLHMAPQLVTSSASLGVRVVVVGSSPVVIWRESGDIKFRAIDLSTMTLQSLDTPRTDARTTTGFDAKVIGSTIVIAYENTPGNALKLYAYSYNAGTNVYTQTATGGITGEAGTDFRKIAIDGISGERIYVAYYVASSSLLRVATANDSTLAQITAPVTQDNTASLFCNHVSIVRTGTGGCTVAWSAQFSVTAGAVSRTTSCAIDTVCAQTSGSLRGTWGTHLLSRLFAQGSRVFVFVADYPSPEFTRYVGTNSYLLEVETASDTASSYIPHRYLGKLDLLVSGGADYGFLPSAATLSSTVSFLPVAFLSSTPQTVANFRCGVRHVRVTTGASLPEDMWRSVEFGGEAYVAGAILSGYDGRAVFDYGVARPAVIGAKSNASPTAGFIGAGTYLYGFVEEWRSNAGIVHRSATSSTSLASGATGTSTLYVLTSALTRKRGQNAWATTTTPDASPQYVIVFRSVANGSNYQRLTYEPNYNVVRKVFQSSSQTITDTRADSDIGDTATTLASRPLMYTAGGILDDDQPPNLVTLMLHKSRLWGVAGDRRTIWFSKSFQDDLGVAPGFSPSFRISMDEDVTALWSMDEKGIVASDGGLWYFVGGDAGPNAAGQGSDIQGPFRIQSDVGCTNPRSVVSTPDGVMFECDGRIYLLTRGLEVVWLGRQVQDKLASFPSITSAVLVPKKNQVRFTCNNSGGTAHTVLVYDYVEKQWSTFRYVSGAVAIADAIVFGGYYHFLATNGVVYREGTSEFASQDVGAWVTMTLETAWIAAAGPLAYQMVRRFALHGVSNSNHGLTVSVGFDRSTSYSPAVTWASGSAVTTVGPLEAAELHLGRKCSSVRFKITDSGGVEVDGRGPSFDSMGIEVGVKRGFQKKPATKRG